MRWVALGGKADVSSSCSSDILIIDGLGGEEVGVLWFQLHSR